MRLSWQERHLSKLKNVYGVCEERFLIYNKGGYPAFYITCPLMSIETHILSPRHLLIY